MTLFEVDEAVNRIKEEVDAHANIIFGSTFDERLEGMMRISIVATGIDVAMDAVRSPKLQVVSAMGAAVPDSGIGTPTEMVADPQISIPPVGIEAARSQPGMSAGSSALQGGSPQPSSAAGTTAPAMPERPEVSEPQPGLRTMASAQLEPDPFIAPPPSEAKVSPQLSRAPDPFAEAAVANGGPPGRRAGPTLLERVAGLGRKVKEEGKSPRSGSEREARTPEPEPLRIQPHAGVRLSSPPALEATFARASVPAQSPKTSPPLASAPPPKVPVEAPIPPAAAVSSPSPTLNVGAEDRIARRSSEDDLLEIPAFLRRQAN